MKIMMNNSDLKAAIDQITPIIPKKPSVPALKAVKIKAENNMIQLSGCDLERYLAVTVSGDVLESGVCIVSLDNLKRLCNVPGNITFISEGHTLTATNGKKKTQVEANIYTESDLPTFPEMENATFLLDMNADVLVSILENLAPFCTQTDIRPIFHGINFNFSEKRFESVDGSRLAVADMETNGSAIHAESGSYVADAVVAGDLRKITKQLTERQRASGVGVYADGKYMQFCGAGFVYIIRRLEGEFLDMRRTLDEAKEAALNITVDVKDVAPVVKEHASYFKRDAKTKVAVFIQNGKLCFYTDAAEVKTSDSLDYEGDVAGNIDDYFWFFNPKFMKEGLEIFGKSTTIDIHGVSNHGWKKDLVSSIGPVFLQGVGDYDVNYTYMVLPVRGDKKDNLSAIRKFCA